MLPDIQTRADIELLINSFYDRVRASSIGYIFDEVMQVNWHKHLPVMYDFWETVLLHTASYKGNPILKHIDVDKQHALTPTHFAVWKQLFFETLDSHYSGPKSDELKTKVEAMEYLMLNKIAASRQAGFIH